MKAVATAIEGLVAIEGATAGDDRGHFTRIFDASDFDDLGLAFTVNETAISHNPRAWTLRGLHFQAVPHQEAKLVRCIAGEVFDVVVDARRESPTYGAVFTKVLRPDDVTLSVPEGCAHGFLTLVDDTEILYHLSVGHVADAARGIRWDDPALDVPWPRQPSVLSDRDRSFPDFAW